MWRELVIAGLFPGVAADLGDPALAVSDAVWLTVGGLGIAVAGVVGLGVVAANWWSQRPRGGEPGSNDDDIDHTDSR